MTLVAALLAVAILAVVPVAMPLHPVGTTRRAAAALVVGMPAALALTLDQGAVAALLTVPWCALALAATVAAGAWWWAGRRRVLDLVWVAAAASLVVGAAWLFADRAGLEPAGFSPPFVQLTAIHFHYAGFATSLLAGCAWRRRPAGIPAAATVLVVAGPPVVAVGFTTFAPLQVAGAGILAIGVWLLGWETAIGVAPATSRGARVLLTVSALATLAPMVLAVQWAIGTNYGTPALSIPDMARWHGTTNAVGFVLLGAWGWRLAEVDRRS